MSRIYSGTWSAFGTFEVEANSKAEAARIASREIHDNIGSFTDLEEVLVDGSETEIDDD